VIVWIECGEGTVYVWESRIGTGRVKSDESNLGCHIT